MIYDNDFEEYHPPTYTHVRERAPSPEPEFYDDQYDEPARPPSPTRSAASVFGSQKGDNSRPRTVNDPSGFEKYLPKRQKAAFTVAELKEHDQRVRQFQAEHATFVADSARNGVYVNPNLAEYNQELQREAQARQAALAPVQQPPLVKKTAKPAPPPRLQSHPHFHGAYEPFHGAYEPPVYYDDPVGSNPYGYAPPPQYNAAPAPVPQTPTTPTTPSTPKWKTFLGAYLGSKKDKKEKKEKAAPMNDSYVDPREAMLKQGAAPPTYQDYVDPREAGYAHPPPAQAPYSPHTYGAPPVNYGPPAPAYPYPSYSAAPPAPAYPSYPTPAYGSYPEPHPVPYGAAPSYGYPAYSAPTYSAPSYGSPYMGY